jgi:CheY-like chemotaxis protein
MSTILVVDDEPTIRDLVRRVLERHGYVVVACSTAAEALRSAAGADLLLVDVMLSDGSGRELVQQVRQNRPDLPVVLMSGYPQQEDAALDPPSMFLQKPMRPQVVVEAVKKLLMVNDQ